MEEARDIEQDELQGGEQVRDSVAASVGDPENNEAGCLPVQPVTASSQAPPEPPVSPPPATAAPGEEAEKQMHRMSRRSFLWSVLAIGSGYGGLRWLDSRRQEDDIPWPMRQALRNNEEIARDFYNPHRLAPQFALSQAVEPRVNGDIGMDDGFNPAQWSFTVDGLARGKPLTLNIHDIRALPRTEMVTEMKCIEGWSVIVHWAGARFIDFAAAYGPATVSGDPPDVHRKPDDVLEYVGLKTPGGEYYVGLDTASALHPQTLLCYEMNGAPLAIEHGGPLRLVTPLKYGIKNIKRIGSISFSAARPPDYWAEQGYDYYAGL